MSKFLATELRSDMHAFCLSCQTSLFCPPHVFFCPNCGSGRLFRTNEELGSLRVAHIDCDSFYAQIEKRDHPCWQNEPIAVGKTVVLSACYIARMHGVRSGMPMFEARPLCRRLRIVAPRFSHYRNESLLLREAIYALRDNHPNLRIEFASIDECWLDFGTKLFIDKPFSLYSHDATGRQEVRRDVWQVLALLQNKFMRSRSVSFSIGLSDNKLLSKLAVRCSKPQGFAALSKSRAQNFLAPHSPQLLPGVGKVTALRLRQQGITRISQLQAQPLWALKRRWGRFAEYLHNMSFGRDASQIREQRKRKSTSIERTFPQCIYDSRWIKPVLRELCRELSTQLQTRGVAGRTVVLKLRRRDLCVISRARSLPYLIASDQQIFNSAARSLDNEMSQCHDRHDHVGHRTVAYRGGYRLVGVSVKSLEKMAPFASSYTLHPEQVCLL